MSTQKKKVHTQLKVPSYVDTSGGLCYYDEELNKFTQCVVYAVWAYAVKRESGANPERNCRCKRFRVYFMAKAGHWEIGKAEIYLSEDASQKTCIGVSLSVTIFDHGERFVFAVRQTQG